MVLELAAAVAAASSINMTNATECFNAMNEPDFGTHCIMQAEEEGYSYPLDDQYVLKDLSGNLFALEIGEDGGFMVIDPISGYFLESTPEGECPYLFVDGFDNYYFGPGQYYTRHSRYYFNSYQDLDTYVSLTNMQGLQSTFDEWLAEFRNNTSSQSYADYRENLGYDDPLIKPAVTMQDPHYIENYQLVSAAAHPTNTNGSCGFVAASLILHYWDESVSDAVVDSHFEDERGELYNNVRNADETGKEELDDKLIEYNRGNADSWARTVANAVNDYCDDYDVDGYAEWFLFHPGLVNSLANNEPVAVFGALPNSTSSGIIFHAAAAYGYDSRWWGNYIIVNYGWGGNMMDALIPSYCIGSMMKFSLDLDLHPLVTERIAWDDYPFMDDYNTTRLTNTLTTQSGYSFKVNRLRCGFIHDEYLTISPRKQGFNEAYIEWNFKNPVTHLEIDIAFWSDDERYDYPNIGYPTIDYRHLGNYRWITAVDLLNGEISTDRDHMTHISLDFPMKIKQLRVRSWFAYISGLNDRNKGRISVGNIIVNTYR